MLARSKFRVMYVACGEIAKYLSISYRSLRKAGYNGEVLVISDTRTPVLPNDVKIVRLAELTGYQTEEATIRGKLLLPRYADADCNVFLDTRTYVTASIADLPDVEGTFAAPLSPYQCIGRSCVDSLDNKLVAKQEAKTTLLQCGRSFPHYDTSILLFRSGAEDLFEAWKAEWAKFYGTDSWALSRALNVVKMKASVIPPTYSVRYSDARSPRKARLAGAKIVHFGGNIVGIKRWTRFLSKSGEKIPESIDLRQFTLQRSEKSHCPCGKPVHILCPRLDSSEIRIYFLCSYCGRVVRAGSTEEIGPAEIERSAEAEPG